MSALQTSLTSVKHDHHGHAHLGHDYGSHGHAGHNHAVHHPAHPSRSEGEPAGAARSRPAVPRFSLIALSGPQRLALVVPAIAILWLLTLWAMPHG